MTDTHSARTGHAQAEPSGNTRAHPSANGGAVEMDTRPLASGIYSVRAVADELLVGTSKFEVLR